MGLGYRQRRLKFRLSRWLFVAFLVVSALFLSGCIRYDVGVTVEGQNGGTISQHVKLGEQLTRFNPSEASRWLKTIEDRAKKLKGKSKYLADDELLVTIPFYNGKDLVSKFNKFFNPAGQEIASSESSTLDAVQLVSEMEIDQSNLILVERDRLSLAVDLRGLEVLSDRSPISLESGFPIAIDFALSTPWGARYLVRTPDGISPPVRRVGDRSIWTLQTGEINHIEVVYWIPSYLGMGFIAIVLLTILGIYVKEKYFSDSDVPVTTPSDTPATTP
ncbi:MAG: DUF3153 domain-containing protein [Cyanobacteria bacterium SBLK]|nr:DUF3153 domain-containing protein [Cyanobacteria bacterium SBLK]